MKEIINRFKNFMDENTTIIFDDSVYVIENKTLYGVFFCFCLLIGFLFGKYY